MIGEVESRYVIDESAMREVMWGWPLTFLYRRLSGGRWDWAPPPLFGPVIMYVPYCFMIFIVLNAIAEYIRVCDIRCLNGQFFTPRIGRISCSSLIDISLLRSSTPPRHLDFTFWCVLFFLNHIFEYGGLRRLYRFQSSTMNPAPRLPLPVLIISLTLFIRMFAIFLFL